MPWQRPTFPPPNWRGIIGAGAFHDSVRNGKRWVHTALVTKAKNIITNYYNKYQWEKINLTINYFILFV
jgi:hypothetical protein